MSPEDWKSVGEAITYLLVGAGGLFTAQKVKSIHSGSPSSESKEGTLLAEAVGRIEEKLDRNLGSVREVRVQVEELATDVQRHGHDLSRLSSGFREVVGRVDSLEARMQRPM
jgi:hypothetical protein